MLFITVQVFPLSIEPCLRFVVKEKNCGFPVKMMLYLEEQNQHSNKNNGRVGTIHKE